MFNHNIKYEWIGLVRDKWIPILLISFLCVTLFAVRNGREKVNDRIVSIAKEKAKVAAIDLKYAANIDSVNKKLKALPKEAWLDPRSLTNIAWDAPRVVSMDPLPLALVSTGQSDLFSHYAKPKLYGEAYTLGFSELSNPVQLLFGSFDLAFVCIYLLPLLVLAFSYNILSADKESGILKLTFSQPVSVYGWLLSKLFLRFAILSSVIILSILISFSFYGINIFSNSVVILKFLLLVLSYVLFWFTAAFIVNLLGKSSGNNALTLVAVWLMVVLFIPSIISQMSNSIYPVPSRIGMIHQYRVAKAEAEKKADEILKSYYRDHPELAPRDSTQNNQYNWMLSYFASSEIINQSVAPILEKYDNALENQQYWVDNLRFLSPAILLQNSLNEISGTSTAHYTDFRRQVMEFADQWKGYFKPRMFANEQMKSQDIKDLPVHTYSAANVKSIFSTDATGTLFYVLLALTLSWAVYKKYTLEGMLNV